MISIGGDGSMAIAQKFVEKGMKVVGVPKTIDNDLGATDVTFGFDTAIHVASEALDRIRDTAESHDRVMLVEVMGRNAGWIALHAGLSGGAHAILIPEIPYRLEPVAEKIKQRTRDGQPFSIVVVAEGATPKGGTEMYLPKELGAMPRLFGAAQRVANGLTHMVKNHDIRVTVLGHVQRGGSPTSFDRILALRFGHAAAELVAKGEFGKMVALRTPNIVAVPISDAIDKQKVVDPKGPMVTAARDIGVYFGDE
jgi:6-phosphofructokinase 1